VPQLWGLILTLVVVVAVAIIKLFIDRAMKNQETKFADTLQREAARQIEILKSELQKTTEEQKFVLSLYASIATYVQEQHDGLMTAYMRLFKGEGATATGEDFAKIASEADNDVMTPFRRHQPFLDEQTSASSSNLLCKMVEQWTIKVLTDPTLHFVSGEQTSRFHDGSLAMHPMRVNAVEPRALDRQPAGNDAHPGFALPLSRQHTAIVLREPGTHYLPHVPGSIIPDEDQHLLALAL
jgi:hypothetical protein